jgi:hypothetical protein
MKHHKQMVIGNVPNLEKLRGAAGKRLPATDPVAAVSVAEMRGVAEMVDFARPRADRPTWRSRLRGLLQRARVWIAALFRRRVL